MSFGQFLRILRARVGLMAAVVLVVMLAAAIVGVTMPKKYTAQTALVIDVNSADPVAGSAFPSQLLAGYIATQVDIIGSERVALRVVELAGLEALPGFQEQWMEATDGQGELKKWIAAALLSRLDVKPSRESNVIRVSYTASNPEFAASIANHFAQAYMETALALKVEPARQYAGWFNERTKGLRDQLEAAQKRLSDYQQEHRIVVTDGRLDVETARLAELSTQLVAVQGQRAESRSRQSEADAGEALAEVTQNPLIANLKGELARREAERDQLRGRLGPNHPEIARHTAAIGALREKIASETRRIASSLGTSNRINQAREAEIAAAVEAQKARVLQLKEHRDRIAVFQRDVESAQRAYDQVTQRLATTHLESQSQQTNVAVLTAASVPLWPSGPRLILKLALAFVVGVVLAIGSALLIELIDQRVRGEDDLVILDGVPLLGTVPAPAPASRRLFTPRLTGPSAGATSP